VRGEDDLDLVEAMDLWEINIFWLYFLSANRREKTRKQNSCKICGLAGERTELQFLEIRKTKGSRYGGRCFIRS
jgi:hypothetical protein